MWLGMLGDGWGCLGMLGDTWGWLATVPGLFGKLGTDRATLRGAAGAPRLTPHPQGSRQCEFHSRVTYEIT